MPPSSKGHSLVTTVPTADTERLTVLVPRAKSLLGWTLFCSAPGIVAPQEPLHALQESMRAPGDRFGAMWEFAGPSKKSSSAGTAPVCMSRVLRSSNNSLTFEIVSDDTLRVFPEAV